MTKLYHDVQAFLTETGMSAYRFGFRAVRNGRLVERLANPSRRIWPETEDRVREFMRSERERRATQSKEARQ